MIAPPIKIWSHAGRTTAPGTRVRVYLRKHKPHLPSARAQKLWRCTSVREANFRPSPWQKQEWYGVYGTLLAIDDYEATALLDGRRQARRFEIHRIYHQQSVTICDMGEYDKWTTLKIGERTSAPCL